VVTPKAARVSLRIDSGVKEALCAAASREYHSIANRGEVLVREYGVYKDIAIPEHNEQPGMKDNT